MIQEAMGMQSGTGKIEEEFKEVEKQIHEKQIREAQEESIKREKDEKEKEIRIKQQQEAAKMEEEKTQERKRKLSSLPEEPAENESNVITIAFRLPDGNRLERRFKNSNKVLYSLLRTFYDFKQVINLIVYM